MAVKKRTLSLPLNQAGTMNGVGKMIGTLPKKVNADTLQVPPGPASKHVNEPALAKGAVKRLKAKVKVKKKPSHVSVKRY